jgi:hypothetical protein
MDTDTTENTSPAPGSGNLYGSYVNTNELARTLDETRVLRLALNVLYDGLPRDITRGPVEDTLATIHDHLTETETRALAQRGFAEHYVVIRPFSPVSLPEEGVMKEITSAIRTLQRHGMLVQAPDAR